MQSTTTVVVEMQMTQSSPYIKLNYSVFFHSCMRFIVCSVCWVVQANFLMPNVYRIITVANGDASVAADASAANATLASVLGLSRINIELFMYEKPIFPWFSQKYKDWAVWLSDIAARQTSLVFANANPSYVEQIMSIFHVGKLIFPWFFNKLLKIEQFGCLDIWSPSG